MRRDHGRRCLDSDCAGYAEPEQDGDLHYWECITCGYTFGYVQLTGAYSVNGDGSCAVGVPESIRRAASIAPPTPGPLLTIGLHRGD